MRGPAVVPAVVAAVAVPCAAQKWTPVGTAPWKERAAPHGAVLNDGTFVICSGRTGYSTFLGDCWASADGKNWTARPQPAWSARAYPDIVKLDNGTLILTGGEAGIGGRKFLNDVWKSDDGARTWTLVVKNAPWKARAGHKSLVVNGEVWVLGGCSARVGGACFSDVWASPDGGRTWEQRTAAAGWAPRAGMETAIVGDGVIVGGGDHDVPVFSSAGPNFNDIWKTSDGGKTWAQIGSADWIERTGQKFMQIKPGGTIYSVGGAHQNGTTYLQHDVWTSEDGLKWTKISDDAWGCAPGPANPGGPDACGRDDVLLVARDGALWTFGGDEETGKGGGEDNDVWRFDPPALPTPRSVSA